MFIVLKACSKIPRKGSIVVPCVALHRLYAFIWHLLLSLSVAWLTMLLQEVSKKLLS